VMGKGKKTVLWREEKKGKGSSPHFNFTLTKTICAQVIVVDGRPGKLIYVQSTDQVWVLQQQQGDDDDGKSEVVVIRRASEHLLHHAVHVDRNQQLGPFTVRTSVCYTPSTQSSNHRANIEQLEHTSCTCILNAFAGCFWMFARLLLDVCLIV